PHCKNRVKKNSIRFGLVWRPFSPVDIARAALVASAHVIRWLLVVLCALTMACGDEIAITPRALPSATPTDEPVPTRTPPPLPSPSSTPAPIAFYVANTGGDGAVLRASPGRGDRVAALGEGVRVVAQGEEADAEGRRWLRVQDPSGKTGWIARELLVVTPVPTRTPARR